MRTLDWLSKLAVSPPICRELMQVPPALPAAKRCRKSAQAVAYALNVDWRGQRDLYQLGTPPYRIPADLTNERWVIGPVPLTIKELFLFGLFLTLFTLKEIDRETSLDMVYHTLRFEGFTDEELQEARKAIEKALE